MYDYILHRLEVVWIIKKGKLSCNSDYTFEYVNDVYTVYQTY